MFFMLMKAPLIAMNGRFLQILAFHGHMKFKVLNESAQLFLLISLNDR